MNQTCIIKRCDNPMKVRKTGYCKTHYGRFKRGRINVTTGDLTSRYKLCVRCDTYFKVSKNRQKCFTCSPRKKEV